MPWQPHSAACRNKAPASPRSKIGAPRAALGVPVAAIFSMTRSSPWRTLQRAAAKFSSPPDCGLKLAAAR
jgi:hypothetical protein